MFRETQIMANQYRNLYSCYMTVAVVVSTMLVHSISLYVCLKFGIDLPLSTFLFFALVAVNSGFILVYMYTSLANIFSASRYILENKLQKGMGNGPWRRRFLNSCKVVKVYIGNTNFVEPLTSLTVEQFSVDQTITLMLLKA